MRHMRAFFWALVLSQVCFAQSVKVRVVNGWDGHSLPRQGVSVEFFYEKPPKVTPPQRLTTDANGEAQFSIPESLPEHIDVTVALTSEYWHCACGVMADTEEVLHKGILQDRRSNVPNAPFPLANREPGQIVFLARPFGFFEELLYPVRKQQFDIVVTPRSN